MSNVLERWLALPSLPGILRTVYVDVDGCLTAGEGRPLDLDVLAEVARMNERSLTDPLVPTVTLCTGRPEPYVELFLQAIGGFFPAIAEHGGIACFPADYHFELHPLLASSGGEFEQVRARMLQLVVGEGVGFLQPGKETMFTLYPNPSVSLAELAAAAQSAVGSCADLFDVEVGRTGVEVRRRGVNKGAGIAWLAEITGVPLSCMAGIGDSDSDLFFLNLVGFAAAPDSAVQSVKASVAYVSKGADARGTLEALQHIQARNRAIARR
jgi:hydroxymethylpyrimidine pyrophosphatase-like HAD family hydrolase